MATLYHDAAGQQAARQLHHCLTHHAPTTNKPPSRPTNHGHPRRLTHQQPSPPPPVPADSGCSRVAGGQVKDCPKAGAQRRAAFLPCPPAIRTIRHLGWLHHTLRSTPMAPSKRSCPRTAFRTLVGDPQVGLVLVDSSSWLDCPAWVGHERHRRGWCTGQQGRAHGGRWRRWRRPSWAKSPVLGSGWARASRGRCVGKRACLQQWTACNVDVQC